MRECPMQSKLSYQVSVIEVRRTIACSKNEEHQPRSVEEEVDEESKGHTILKSFVFTSRVQPLKSLIRKIIHNNCNVITTKNFRGKLNHNLYK